MNQRPIKFRAWDNKTKLMGSSFSLESASYEGFPRPFTDDNGESDLRADYVVMQFTGLLDKHGKEIYEGDLISWWGNDVREVLYDPETGGWNTLGRNLVAKRTRHRLYKGNGEIIGNIYENKDLLS